MIRKLNPANKERRLDKGQTPYASWTCGKCHYKLLKSWQSNQHKEYARWFIAVSSPYTFGDYELGDEYVKEVWPSLQSFLGMTNLVIDTTVWESEGSFLAWAFDEE